MIIDLHSHSTASDGTLSPAEVVRLAASIGIDVLALTDHDSAAGWAEATHAAREVEVALVPGIEISTKHSGTGVHLLAYLPDPTSEPLDAELTRILNGRAGRLDDMVQRLNDAGIDLTVEEVLTQVGPAPAIGRPHIADALVGKGVVPDRKAAFERWLNRGRPAHVERYAPDTGAMIELVNAAGGAAVIAHPWGRDSRQVLDAATFSELTETGLAGIEVDHQDHDSNDREALRRIARELGLVVTGSSDFHGDGKLNHNLGCNCTDEHEFDRLLGRAAANAERSGAAVPLVVGR
ncbi:MAG: PHP domain-containing protein [Nocardioidaceae bacterium]